MGEFRDRMERDLRIRGFSSATQRCYLARMKALVEFFMRPPDELTVEDIHAYQLHLTRDRKVGWSTFNQSVCAIRFFYGVTLRSAWDIQRIPYQKTGRTLPMVLSPEEVSKLFRVVTNLKHRAILMTTYSGGLRVSEVTHLRVSDVDPQRMILRVEQGKGRQDRYVMLSHKLLPVLREYWKSYETKHWLFPGRNPERALRESRSGLRSTARIRSRTRRPGQGGDHRRVAAERAPLLSVRIVRCRRRRETGAGARDPSEVRARTGAGLRPWNSLRS